MNTDKYLIERINNECKGMKENINIMEVCGTHTDSIYKNGIKELISSKINLISGPGCPICVTDNSYIESAKYLLKNKVNIISFGDISRVASNGENILNYKNKKGKVYIVYNPYDSIKIVQNNPNKTFVFLAIGFETTAPIIAYIIKETYERGIKNLYFLCSIKLMPPIISYILNSCNNIHGIICPGNVSVITGYNYFNFIYDKYKTPAVVSGFKSEEILLGIYYLVKVIRNDSSYKFINLYDYVKKCGNLKCISIIKEVFEKGKGNWRGIGQIQKSALNINKKYCELDACKHFNLNYEYLEEKNHCLCNSIILGKALPYECKLFKNICNLNNPLGPCMVSSEGLCRIFCKYERG